MPWPWTGAQTAGENLEDEQVKGALKESDALGFFLSGRHTTGVCVPSGRMSTGKARYRDEVSLGHVSLRKAIEGGLAQPDELKRKRPVTEAVDPALDKVAQRLMRRCR